MASDIRLREVIEEDLPILFEYQREPAANAMAAFPARDWDAFMLHWSKVLRDETSTTRIVLLDGKVAGSIVSWQRDGKHLVGYWIGRAYWGKGIATKALAEFVHVVSARPLFAYVAKHNVASIRVLEKGGFTNCGAVSKSPDEPSDGVEEFLFMLGDGTPSDRTLS